MKTGYILIDFDVIFPMRSSEFIKPLNFGSNLKKKNSKKNQKKKISLKIDFNRFEIENLQIDLN